MNFKYRSGSEYRIFLTKPKQRALLKWRNGGGRNFAMDRGKFAIVGADAMNRIDEIEIGDAISFPSYGAYILSLTRLLWSRASRRSIVSPGGIEWLQFERKRFIIVAQ